MVILTLKWSLGKITAGPDKWINTEDDDVKIVTEDQEQESAEDSDVNMSSSSDVEVIKEIKFDRSKLVDSIGMYQGFDLIVLVTSTFF